MVFSMDVGKDKWNGLRVADIVSICFCAVSVFVVVLLNSCKGSTVNVGEVRDSCMNCEVDDAHFAEKKVTRGLKGSQCWCSLPLKRLDFSKCKRYQTFDEFKMCGVGKPVSSPFVYVMQDGDIIYVVASNDTADVKFYCKTGNKWYDYEEYDLWNKDAVIMKTADENIPRTYYRVCGGDSILELRCSYMGDVVLKDLYIKTAGECVWVTHWPVKSMSSDAERDKSCFEELCRLVGLFNEGEGVLQSFIKREYKFKPGVNVYHYRLMEDDGHYVYECRSFNERLYFSKSSLSLFGIQPGLERFDMEKSVVH